MGLSGIKTTFFRSNLKSQGSLALVEYEDGTLGITRDGQPLEGCRWKPGRLDQSIKAFRDISARLQSAETSKS
jgi:hypothetical protein